MTLTTEAGNNLHTKETFLKKLKKKKNLSVGFL